MQQPGAPSVEEILVAIKQVIARDNRAPGRACDARAADAHAADAHAANAHAADQGDAEGRARGQDDVLDLALLEGLTDAAADDGHAPESLITAEARHSMRESLAALTMLAEPRAQPQIVRSGETSLEGMVREMLRPALTEWLDKNLPALVERLVATEIARIVGKRA